jgi:hypothetical protein
LYNLKASRAATEAKKSEEHINDEKLTKRPSQSEVVLETTVNEEIEINIDPNEETGY